MEIKYQVIKNHFKSYDSPPQFKDGAQVIMERRDDRWRSWIWCSDLDGRSAWIPELILSLDFNNRAILKTDYNSAELSVEIGETVIGNRILDGWIWCRNNVGNEGWVPEDNLELYLE